MWTDQFKQLQATLDKADDTIVLKQFDECKNHSPELHAAVSFLGLALEYVVLRMDACAADGSVEKLFAKLPLPAIRLVQRSPLTISPDELCRRLQLVEASQILDAFVDRGEMREPRITCDDR